MTKPHLRRDWDAIRRAVKLIYTAPNEPAARVALDQLTLLGRVAELRPAYLPPDPAGRTVYAAGEIAQCDFWFPDIVIPVGFGQTRTAKLLPVLTMVCGYSRFASAALVVANRGGPVRRLVAVDRRIGRGAAGAGLGR